MPNSPLDKFIAQGTAVGDPVMGTDTLVVSLSGGGTLDITGVWSTVTQTNMADEGGFMAEVDASIAVPAASGIDNTLVGLTGTAKGGVFRIRQVEVGEVITTVFVADATEIL